ncbi:MULTISPECIES: ornithine carbamoyltransferase [unclassified Thermosynechococcus]|uniref:ornithine carbamoyltransferase n=1 Tax=unclassified Thermosynechococcus TaxID=2622553 RepID=UPI00197EA733|nr:MULTISPECIES: ornithine carbamoyltransferase [unclassified Thermosynechococcus]QSF49521.1 ornithine carbamoyltransferase [Thermosynechococcus sp. TA-1]WNC22599.1 ornithine carbamoyltransferase [Thermosynechococcus sp. PP22]WNC32838.1 ornithine carbamoyltransferase [Thermosynechococcus sp. PKX95]WNC35364.1 ornithine carbamoyltransferase [Thermosynechococcus sp. PKX91]WNC37884.1 ornithine carbamoyltransferase [Thermosynechococcus sp. WL11]
METLRGRDLLSIADLSRAEAEYLLDLAAQMKIGKVAPQCPKVLGLLFQKASTRTRVSFTVAMYQLGGQVIDLNPQSTQVGRGEPLPDTARVLDRYLDAVAIRTYGQAELQLFADYARIPVINALTDREHPCQILADLLTLRESFGTLAGLTLCYIGDGNNVAHSLLLGCALLGVNIRVASPPPFAPLPDIVTQAKALSGGKSEVTVLTDPQAAAKGAHALYTDVWASMGQEAEAGDRQPIFQPYQINDQLLALADPRAIVLHCLPAHRGEEITASVLEGPQSRVWEQAENRLHAQKALLASLLG